MSSTRLTTQHRDPPIMTDSATLSLAHQIAGAQRWILDHLLRGLSDRSHNGLTGAQLIFLGELDCGPNHASEIARRLRMTRQAVHRMTRELSKRGILSLAGDPARRNQKTIRFTPYGEQVMADARNVLAALDIRLVQKLGRTGLKTLQELMDRGFGEDSPANGKMTR